MLGKLNDREVEDLLENELIGRIGCSADGITYIVPVNYFYEKSFVYAHSADGLKIDKMRKNPNVCFEVDRINNLANWQSVIAWGRFEEIEDIYEKQEAMQKLANRIMPFISHEMGHPSHGITARESDIGTTIELIVYRIALTWKNGRFEKN